MDEYLGIIKPFAGTFVPIGWLPCDGRKLPISGNEALFSIFGNLYGGDGVKDFALPNLNGRAVVGTGQGTNLTKRQIAQSGGDATVTITQNTFPQHTHASFALTADATSSDPKGRFLTKTPNLRYCIQQGSDKEEQMGSDVIYSAWGGNQPHDNMPPYMAINYIICVEGLYPVRA